MKSPLLKHLNSSLVRHLYVLCIPLPKNLLKLTMHGISFSVRRTRQVTICLPHLTVYHITLKEPTSRHISGIQHFVQCLPSPDGLGWKLENDVLQPVQTPLMMLSTPVIQKVAMMIFEIYLMKMN